MSQKRLSQREVRHTLHERLTETAEMLGKLANNDRVSQHRIVQLTEAHSAFASDLAAFKGQSFWQRLRWLVRGV